MRTVRADKPLPAAFVRDSSSSREAFSYQNSTNLRNNYPIYSRGLSSQKRDRVGLCWAPSLASSRQSNCPLSSWMAVARALVVGVNKIDLFDLSMTKCYGNLSSFAFKRMTRTAASNSFRLLAQESCSFSSSSTTRSNLAQTSCSLTPLSHGWEMFTRLCCSGSWANERKTFQENLIKRGTLIKIFSRGPWPDSVVKRPLEHRAALTTDYHNKMITWNVSRRCN